MPGEGALWQNSARGAFTTVGWGGRVEEEATGRRKTGKRASERRYMQRPENGSGGQRDEATSPGLAVRTLLIVCLASTSVWTISIRRGGAVRLW
jgi:hypothetical protein